MSPVDRSALSARLKYSEAVLLKDPALFHRPAVEYSTELLSVRLLPPWASARDPLVSSKRQYATKEVSRLTEVGEGVGVLVGVRLAVGVRLGVGLAGLVAVADAVDVADGVGVFVGVGSAVAGTNTSRWSPT